jgi:hypothetical protein
MSDDLLENARQQAEKAEPSMRSTALLRIARAESIANATESALAPSLDCGAKKC